MNYSIVAYNEQGAPLFEGSCVEELINSITTVLLQSPSFDKIIITNPEIGKVATLTRRRE